MIYVPEKFQPKHPFPYPPDNTCEYERWYYDNYDYQETEREYLPIFWTAFYVKNKFGQHQPAMVDLQKFINTLDQSKKYYTIVQYDGGIQNDISHLDIQVFSMSGGKTDYPLPLISQAHAPVFRVSKYYFANFIGKMTHPIRKKLKMQSWFMEERTEWYFSENNHTIEQYCHKLTSSLFTLCPRGFGPTSFRIQEALQYGSIPAYISDEWVIPHNIPFTDYGVLIDAADAHRVHDILMSIPPEEIKRKQEAIPEVYKKYYTYEGCRQMIKLHLKNPAHESVT